MRETVLREFPDLRKTGPVRLRVRIVRVEGQNKPRLDVRKYIEGRIPTPWTRKGIRLSAGEVDALLKIGPQIRRALSAQSRLPHQARPDDGGKGGRTPGRHRVRGSTKTAKSTG